MTTPKQRPPRRKRLMLSAAALVVSLAIAELVLTATRPAPVVIRFQQDTEKLAAMQLDRFSQLLTSDSDRFWRLSPNSRLPDSDTETRGPFFGVIANGQGFREDHEIPRQKPAGETRLLFLGDSCTFGYGVACHETYVEQCEQALERSHPERPFECINAGVPGYTVYQGWRVLESEGDWIRPDVVVVCFGFNDRAEWDGLSDLEHFKQQPPGWMSSSQLLTRTWLLGHPASPRLAQTPRVSAEDYRALLIRIRQTTRRLGAHLVLISWCERFQITTDRNERTPWQKELTRFAERHNVPMLDLVPRVQQWDDQGAETDPGAFFLDIVHVLPVTHVRIGRELTTILDPLVAREALER